MSKVTFTMEIELPKTEPDEARQIIQQALYYAREHIEQGINNQTIVDPQNWKIGFWAIKTQG